MVSSDSKYSPPYTILATGYDVIMQHVDYEDWADYIYDLLQEHHPKARTILELGCGTGSLALALQWLGDYNYAGTDQSATMIRVARAKAEAIDASIQFEVADFTDFRVDPPVDVVLLVHDGLNYLHTEAEILALLKCAHQALRPGGLFVFDQSTPANSINNAAFFDDTGEAEGFRYVRHSTYDRERQLHTTEFELTVGNKIYHERHIQRAYRIEEIDALIRRTPFEMVQVYDSFSDAPASGESERLHWILRKVPNP